MRLRNIKSFGDVEVRLRGIGLLSNFELVKVFIAFDLRVKEAT